jgi:uncharacterized membrane protein
MFTTYALYKFLHIVGSIIWLGTVFALTFLNLRITRAADRTTQAAVIKYSDIFGFIIGPTVLITLFAGIMMAVLASIPFNTLWITWGFTGLFLSMITGGILTRRTTASIRQLLQDDIAGASQLQAKQRQLVLLNGLNLFLLLSTVWAMVFKPVL